MSSDITPFEESVLLVLSEHLSLSRNKCAQIAGVKAGSVANTAKRLIERDLVEQIGTAGGRTSSEIAITPKGVRALMDSQRRRAQHQAAPKPLVPPRTHAHIQQHYVPEPCVYRNDGLKHILSHGVRC